MKRLLGLALTGTLACACGHATPTGSARNDWNTPTGYATATNPRYLNPSAGIHPAKNRTVFETREAPPLQPPPAETAPAPETMPPAETLPPNPTEP
jgi:hypothetical protein